MIGNKTKEFSFGKIIKQEDLKSLNDFIASEYKNVRYSIRTKNGINFDLENYDKLITYENYTESKIEWIKIDANRDIENKYFTYSDLHLFMGIYTEYTIRNSSEKDILFISDKIDKLINNFKSPHDWIFSFFGSLLVNSVAALLIILLFLKIIPIHNLSTVWGIILCASIIPFQMLVYLVILPYLYPKTTILIGKQIDVYETKRKIRKSINTIFLGFIITYIVTLILQN